MVQPDDEDKIGEYRPVKVCVGPRPLLTSQVLGPRPSLGIWLYTRHATAHIPTCAHAHMAAWRVRKLMRLMSIRCVPPGVCVAPA